MRRSEFSWLALLCLTAACGSSVREAGGSGDPSADSFTGAAGATAPTVVSDPVATPITAPPVAPGPVVPAPEPTTLAPDPTPVADPSGDYPLALDECGLDTGFPGDEQCILPPPPDQGFQIHIGPDDYGNIDPRYILGPMQESTRDFTDVSTNDTDIFFYYRQYRMRPGAHHAILSRTDLGGIAGGRRIGTANMPGDSPPGGVIAPENVGVGIPLAPRTTVNVSFHTINVTPQPILQEIWVNFWYRDPNQVTEEVHQLFETGDVTFAIQPGADVMLGTYTCDIPADGRILWFYGHRHASTLRFSAWRERNGERDLFYEGLHWEEPLWLEYASNVQNPAPDRANGIEGGWSGVLDLRPGDSLVWECHVVNEQDTVLRFTNETFSGEMCIMDGEIVGTNCQAGFGGFGGF